VFALVAAVTTQIGRERPCAGRVWTAQENKQSSENYEMKIYPYLTPDGIIDLVEKRELDKSKAVIQLLEDALIDISEYWDQDEREESMRGACWTALEIADAALKKSRNLK